MTFNAYLSPGISRTLVAMSADSGQSFSINSSGAQIDLLCEMKDFLANRRKKTENKIF